MKVAYVFATPRAASYKLGQMPDLCFIGADGVIADLYMGFTPCSEETVEPRIAELLNPTITRG